MASIQLTLSANNLSAAACKDAWSALLAITADERVQEGAKQATPSSPSPAIVIGKPIDSPLSPLTGVAGVAGVTGHPSASPKKTERAKSKGKAKQVTSPIRKTARGASASSSSSPNKDKKNAVFQPVQPQRKSNRKAPIQPTQPAAVEPVYDAAKAVIVLRQTLSKLNQGLAQNINDLCVRNRSQNSFETIFKLSETFNQIAELFEKALDEVINQSVSSKMVAADIVTIARRWSVELSTAVKDEPSTGRLKLLLASLSSKFDDYAHKWMKVIKTAWVTKCVYSEDGELHEIDKMDQHDYGSFILLWGAVMEQASKECDRKPRHNVDDLWQVLSEGVAKA